jgi:hypothetical protein
MYFKLKQKQQQQLSFQMNGIKKAAFLNVPTKHLERERERESAS